ncbi:hypothetical protein ACFWP5_32555 [Streptomyces sp. NPDC058469]|uniref:hypothetical protein n=1 Tax=Streptomyces sp. NPDC058469 TaxID=3346514 RepID=UPI003661AB88
MQITLSLPEFDATPATTWTGEVLHDPDAGLCDGCGYERNGLMVKLVPFGWLHAEDEDGAVTCLQKAVDRLAAPDMTTAWTSIAQHVAKYPHRHTTATIRAVITELAKLAARPAADR